MNKRALLKVMEVLGAELSKAESGGYIKSSLYDFHKKEIANLRERIERLDKENADLRERVARLGKENAELRQGVEHET